MPPTDRGDEPTPIGEHDPPPAGPRLLDGYVWAHGLTYRDVGARLDPPTSRQTVARWCRGDCRPGPAYRAQLERLTDGLVPADAWSRALERERASWLAAHPVGEGGGRDG